LRATRAEPGSVLAFLPGAAEIRRTQAQLEGRTEAATDVAALYGALGGDEQDRAILPAPPGRRKIVLATSIAETSITIEGVRIVVDSGLARVPRYEPDVGVTRLETVRVSRAAADQRRGRAGRTEPGVCYRLWDEPQTAVLEPFARPEILAADLSSFALDLAAWGAAPDKLAFLDPPPRAAFAEAQALLKEIGALDADGRITAEGRRLRALALPPRLARMIVDSNDFGAAGAASDVAAVLTERGLGGDSVDLDARLDQFRRDRSQRAQSARELSRRWASQVEASSGTGAKGELSTGVILAFAYPDRVAKNRGNGSFVLANGRGASVERGSALARAPYVAVGELSGTAAAGRILLAAPILQEEIELHFADHIEIADEVAFDSGALALRARRKKTLHAIILSESPLAVKPTAETARVLADGLIEAGLDKLPWSKTARQWRDRVMFLRRAEGEGWPDLSDDALIARRDDWLAPALFEKTSLKDLSEGDLSDALMTLLPWELRTRLDREAPTHFEAPTGSRLAIDYEAEQGPTIAVRLQELFGLTIHPSIAKGKVPLVLELLSPAHRPVQVTRDLPGFWRGSYAAVRADLRGRYPRHPWPEDPAAAPPTRRAKPRGT